jgi:hypothetical protein
MRPIHIIEQARQLDIRHHHLEHDEAMIGHESWARSSEAKSDEIRFAPVVGGGGPERRNRGEQASHS